MQIDEKIESYVIGNTLYVNTTFIARYKNITPRQITNHIKNGMERHKLPGISSNLFVLEHVDKFIREIPNKNKSSLKQNTRRVEVPDEQNVINEFDYRLIDPKDLKLLIIDDAIARKAFADAKKAEEDADIAEIKRKTLTGETIDADDVDKSLSEMQVMHMTKLDNDEKMLPILLGLTEKQTQLLHEHNEDHLNLLDSQVEQRFSKDPSNYDVFHEVLLARRKGATPKMIISMVKLSAIDKIDEIITSIKKAFSALVVGIFIKKEDK